MPSEAHRKEIHEQLNKARKHTGAPLPNMVGDQPEGDAAGVGVGVALLLVDVINDIEFEGNEYIVEEAKKMGPKVRNLMNKCRDSGIPIIYCNDNFGRWRSNLQQIYEHVTENNTPGKAVAEMLKPRSDDYFVLKPKHSAFYATALDSLLTYLRIKTLIIVGMAGNVCILFTANDAYMRDFATFVPKDCIASTSSEESAAAILLMERVLRTTTRNSDELDLDHILEVHKKHGLANENDLQKSSENNSFASNPSSSD